MEIWKWLDSSGWTAALVQADIATPGKADSFLKASHVSRTRHAHQVTAAALYTMLQKAYSSYCEEHNDHAGNCDKWRQLKEDKNPQFKFWSLTLEIQLSVLVVVRSLIKRRGLLHQALQKIAPLMFALDHHLITIIMLAGCLCIYVTWYSCWVQEGQICG